MPWLQGSARRLIIHALTQKICKESENGAGTLNQCQDWYLPEKRWTKTRTFLSQTKYLGPDALLYELCVMGLGTLK